MHLCTWKSHSLRRACRGSWSSESPSVVTYGSSPPRAEPRLSFDKTAVAGSVDLRCYCSIRSRSDDKVTLSLPDARFEQTWNLSDIPFSLASEPDATPVPELMGHLAPLIDPQSSSHGRLAAMSFLYLFSRLAKPSR